jgi:CDP-glucose 4,6-dehydratase
MALRSTNAPTPEFWQNKTILVTGHTGFKGGWLSLWLHLLGATVVGYALEPPTVPSFFRALDLGNLLTSYIGDIGDYERLCSIVQRHQPDVVFHLAAQPLVRPSYALPLQTFATNVMGTANVLEVIRHTPSVRAAVMVTTDKVYENREWVWSYRENDILGGHDPYSASKAASELVIESYRRSFFGQPQAARVASVRAGNVIGGGDWANDRLVPDIMRSIEHNKPLRLRYPNSVRPWQYVLEPLSGYLLLAERLCTPNGSSFAEAWNFGPHDSNLPTVEELVALVNTLWRDNTVNVAIEQSEQLYETTYLQLDCSKSQRRLGWCARLSTNDALRLTVEWYEACLNHSSAESLRRISEQQIRFYQQLS